MFSTLRNRFGIPGVISVTALVFAMLGGAYAASSNDNGKATASAKAKKGPRGPKGATGPAGPAGAQGPAGANGKDGTNGSNGSNGAAGAPGSSVTAEEFTGSKEGHCVEGGSKFTAGATKTFACNGEDGEAGAPGSQGPKGDPWTPDNVLPAGATETGVYAFTGAKNAEYAEPAVSLPISFTVAAASVPTAVFVPAAGPNPDPAHCPGEEGEPKAASGYLCVYGSLFNFRMPEPFVLTKKTGAVLTFFEVLPPANPEETSVSTSGSWAVTG